MINITITLEMLKSLTDEDLFDLHREINKEYTRRYNSFEPNAEEQFVWTGGKRIQAVKMYRYRTGSDLKASKEAFQKIGLELNNVV